MKIYLDCCCFNRHFDAPDRLLRKAHLMGDSAFPAVANPAAWIVALNEGEAS